jgi:hypothetical protein
MGTAIGVVVGGLITILTAAWIEYLRTPRLTLSIEDPPCDLRYGPGSPATDARYLRLVLRNAALPALMRWMLRSAALQCRGEVTFHHLDDGQDIFGKSMPARWAASPQPIANQIIEVATGQVRYVINDYTRVAGSRIDVYPGEETILDVAVRLDAETDCYGWNDDAYRYLWRNPEWKFGAGRYLVKAVVSSSGRRCVAVVRLLNEGQRSAFRLEPALSADIEKVS